jgi:hypothetical protein
MLVTCEYCLAELEGDQDDIFNHDCPEMAASLEARTVAFEERGTAEPTELGVDEDTRRAWQMRGAPLLEVRRQLARRLEELGPGADRSAVIAVATKLLSEELKPVMPEVQVEVDERGRVTFLIPFVYWAQANGVDPRTAFPLQEHVVTLDPAVVADEVLNEKRGIAVYGDPGPSQGAKDWEGFVAPSGRVFHETPRMVMPHEAEGDVLDELASVAGLEREEPSPARPKCRHCPHPEHTGPCTARNGGTGYACPCHHDAVRP